MKSDPIQEAEAFGVDVSQIRDNLRLSPEMRIRQHQQALNLAKQLKEAGRKFYGRSRQPSSSSHQQ